MFLKLSGSYLKFFVFFSKGFLGVGINILLYIFICFCECLDRLSDSANKGAVFNHTLGTRACQLVTCGSADCPAEGAIVHFSAPRSVG